MKILLDESTPRNLRRELPPHVVLTTKQMGWTSYKNGVLLSLAEGNGFDLLITCDKNMVYQQNLKNRTIAVLVLETNLWGQLEPILDSVRAAVERVGPGEFFAMESKKQKR